LPGPRPFDIEPFVGTHHSGSSREVRALDAYIKLARCTNTLDSLLAAGLAEHGMTAPQFGALEALLHLGPLCQRDLGQKMLRTGGSVTSLVDKLEEKGLVRRERATDDRRIVNVQLTPSGRRLITKVFPQHLERIVAAFAVLNAREQDDLGRLCRKLGRGLG
jgi:MarR family 2-MHQ and catechol resistance regulon transcriptional repressor